MACKKPPQKRCRAFILSESEPETGKEVEIIFQDLMSFTKHIQQNIKEVNSRTKQMSEN